MTDVKECILGKVHGFMDLPITNERIELRTVSDVKYAQYRLLRLQLEYPEKFQNTKSTGVKQN